MIHEQFFDQFQQVLDTVPALSGEEALYAQFRSLMDAANRDPEIRETLVSTAVGTEREVIAAALRMAAQRTASRQ